MSRPRPAIPPEMKREVRRRCRFGCVICGQPFIHYDHIIDYAVVKEHTAENLTLLCAGHHDQKTRGLLPVELIQDANEKPFNQTSNNSSPFALPYGKRFPGVSIASSYFECTRYNYFMPIAVDDIPIIFISQDEPGQRFLLTVQLFDRYNVPVLRIEENELTLTTGRLHDVEFVKNVLTISAPDGIFIELEFSGPDTLNLNQGTILCNGIRFSVLKNGEIDVNGAYQAVAAGCRVDAPVGMALGNSERFPEVGLRLANVPRYPPYVPLGDGGD